MYSNEEWNGRLIISDPARLLNEIAQRYQTTERVFMEFVDNSIDEADDIARNNEGRYPYPIKIRILIDSKNRLVRFIDNGRGMTFSTLCRIIKNIGESQKRGCPWLNGRFGFGIHSFRAVARTIEFRTKHISDNFYKLKFTRDQFKGIPRPEVIQGDFPTDTKTGTEVIISDFESEFFNEISPSTIKEEIELHFETLLHRDNLEITIQLDNEEPVICKPFNYDKIDGVDFRKEEIIEYGGEKYNIKINLKVTKILVHKKPMFFNQGRRIAEIKDIPSFMRQSKYKTALWGHNNLIGYIECGGLTEPVITRDDFKRNKQRKKLYDLILGLEDDIKEAIDQINKTYEEHSFTRLEQVLSSVLRKIAREDALRFRNALVIGGGDIDLSHGGGASTGEEGGPIGPEGGDGSFGGPGEGTGPGPTNQGNGSWPGYGEGGPLPEESSTNTGYRGSTRKQSGFNIRFVNLPDPPEGKPIMSQFLDGTINVNINHPHFVERMERTIKGAPKITHRLVAYLAGIISIWYKDAYYTKYGRQPEIRTELFSEQVEFIYRLESALQSHINDLNTLLLSDTNEKR